MQVLSLGETLTSKRREIKNSAKKVEKVLPTLLYDGMRNRSDVHIRIEGKAELFSFLCCLINYSLKPSPDRIDCPDAARDVLSKPKNRNILKSLISTESTHVFKAADSSLPALMLRDTTDRVEPSEDHPLGLCSDTLDAPEVINMGAGAHEAGFIPLFLCRFIIPGNRVATISDLLLPDADAQMAEALRESMEKLDAQSLLDELIEIKSYYLDMPTPDEAMGPMLLFPLHYKAIEQSAYICLSPIPSATMLTHFKDHYFQSIEAYRALDLDERSPEGADIPDMETVAIVGSQAQNCGSAVQSMGGIAVAYKARVGFSAQANGHRAVERKLKSRLRSLMSVDKHLVSFLCKETPYRVIRMRWEAYLPSMLADACSSLINLRQCGPTVEMAEVRSLNTIEKNYIYRNTPGDKRAGRLLPADIHEIATYFTRKVDSSIIRQRRSVGLNEVRKNRVYMAFRGILETTS